MEEKGIQQNMPGDDISLKQLILKLQDFFRHLKSKWIIILFFGLLGGVLGLVFAYLKEPVYTATSTFVLEEGDKGGGMGQYAGLASIAGIDLGGSGGGGGIFQGDNLLELYRSRNMIQKTLLSGIEINGHKKLLIDLYIEINKLRKVWAGNPELENIDFVIKSGEKYNRKQDSLLGIFVTEIKKNNLFVAKPDKKLGIIEVDVKSNNEQFSNLFNNQIVKTVNDFYIQTKTKKSLQNVQILQQKTDSVRLAMNGAIYSAASIIDATPNLNPTRQLQRTAPVQRSQVSAEANKIILAELVKNLELSKISLRKEAPLIQLIDEPVLPLEVQKVGKAKTAIIGFICAAVGSVLVLLFMRIFSNLLE